MSPYDHSVIWQAAPYILRGTGYTIALILGAMTLGFVVGLPLASAQVYGPRWSRRLAGLYIWLFRGVPLLVLLFLFYFGIFGALENFLRSLLDRPVNLPPFLAAVTALGLASGAYQSQIFRGAMLSLPHGQFLAAQSLGFSRLAALRHVVLPQTLRLSIPGWSNEYSILLKDSAVAYVLGTLEIMARISHMASTTQMHVRFYIMAGVVYYLLTMLGVKALKILERKTRIPGLGVEPAEAASA
jgi:polar amino acid transport system permease protein